MTDYVREIKKQFRDKYKFAPTGGTSEDPTFADGTIPDGVYRMEIGGQTDDIIVRGGRINCCNIVEIPDEKPASAARAKGPKKASK